MNYQHTQYMIEVAQAIEAARTLKELDCLRSGLKAEVLSMAQKMNTNWARFDSHVDLFTAMSNLLHLMQSNRTLQVRESVGRLVTMLKRQQPKKHIVFLAQEFSLWPSFQSVWESFQAQGDVTCTLVISYDYEMTRIPWNDYNAMVTAYRNAGYTPIPWKEYDLMKDCPDMVFYMKPYERRRSNPLPLMIETVKEYVPYTVFISYCFDVQGGKNLYKFFYGMPAFYHMWRIIGYSKFYRDMMAKYGYRNAENVAMLGHPKYDTSYRVAHDDRYLNPDWQAKIAGRPVVLWNSHFSISPNEGVGTFYRWRFTQRDYLLEHPDIVLLWRPHPIFWELIDQKKVAAREQLIAWINGFAALPNVILDKSGDYRHAFRTSDAMISDATTFLAEYRPSGKPILFTPKPDGEFVINPAYVNGLRSALIPQDLIAFLESVRLGTIAAETEGGNFFEEQVGECDGHVGERIAQYVIAEMQADITKRAASLPCSKEAYAHV